MTSRLRGLLGSDGLGGRFSRYLLVGGSAAVVDLGVFVLLSEAGLGVPAAAAASFSIAVAYNFTLSSVVVFRVGPTWHRLVLFMSFALVGLVVNTSVTVLAAGWMPGTLAKVAGIAVAFGANFWMNNAIVFRQIVVGPSGRSRGRDPARHRDC